MLNERIRTYIYNSGRKYSSVAKEAGIPNNVFSAMLHGKRKIKAEEYFSICRALGVPLEQFIPAR